MTPRHSFPSPERRRTAREPIGGYPRRRDAFEVDALLDELDREHDEREARRERVARYADHLPFAGDEAAA